MNKIKLEIVIFSLIAVSLVSGMAFISYQLVNMDTSSFSLSTITEMLESKKLEEDSYVSENPVDYSEKEDLKTNEILNVDMDDNVAENEIEGKTVYPKGKVGVAQLLSNPMVRNIMSLGFGLIAIMNIINFLTNFKPEEAVKQSFPVAMSIFMFFKWEQILAWVGLI